MPTSPSASSSTRPAGPANGRPARSSLSPGCSPIIITSAARRPSPKTVCVAFSQRWHARQPAAAARSAESDRCAAASSAADISATSQRCPASALENAVAARTAGNLLRRHRNPEEGSHAPTRSEEGYEARAPVRAHQGERTEAGQVAGAREGDRSADREQGARSLRLLAHGVAQLDARHLVVAARRAAVGHLAPEGPDERAALQRGAEAEHPRPLVDEQGTAPA